MSTRIMTKQCVSCRRTYTYNPSTGNLGLICGHCGHSQGMPPVKTTHTGGVFKRKG